MLQCCLCHKPIADWMSGMKYGRLECHRKCYIDYRRGKEGIEPKAAGWWIRLWDGFVRLLPDSS